MKSLLLLSRAFLGVTNVKDAPSNWYGNSLNVLLLWHDAYFSRSTQTSVTSYKNKIYTRHWKLYPLCSMLSIPGYYKHHACTISIYNYTSLLRTTIK